NRIQGTGLGMAITKNLLDLMGGKITVKSEKGRGAFAVVYKRTDGGYGLIEDGDE
ncbi:MAG: hypothetical protein HFF03_03995, partial [Oscillospiraceae bacterium]|nr:hypothetical protein [Oscillospiraceae bacterium]